MFAFFHVRFHARAHAVTAVAAVAAAASVVPHVCVVKFSRSLCVLEKIRSCLISHQ